MAGIPSATESPIIHDVSRAAKRLTGTRLINKEEPILPGMIKKLVEASNLDNLLNLFVFSFWHLPVFSELRTFLTLGMVILLFMTLMLL